MCGIVGIFTKYPIDNPNLHLIRAPFLDHRLIEFAFGLIPDSLRATLNERKFLLRKLAKRILPPALDINRKQSFSLPLSAWFKGEWGTFITGVLMEAHPSIFNKEIIMSLIKGQRLGLANTNRLFALTCSNCCVRIMVYLCRTDH